MNAVNYMIRLTLSLICLLCAAFLEVAAQSPVEKTASEKPALVLQTGHTLKANCAAFAPDNSWLATGGADNVIKIWETATGRELRTLRGHTGEVRAVAVSPDGQTLASAGNDRVARLWNVKTGGELRTFPIQPKPLLSLAWSPDGRWLVTGGADGVVKIWDTTNGANIATLNGHAVGVLTLAFSHDAALLATGDNAGVIKLWDTGDWREAAAPAPHPRKITALAFSADRKLLASGSLDGSLKLWQVAQKKPASVNLPTGAPVLAVRFRPDGALAVGRADGYAESVNPTTGASNNRVDMGRLAESQAPALDLFVWNPAADWAATSIGDRNLTVRSVTQPDAAQQLTNKSGVPLSVAFSPDGRWFAFGTNERAVRLWDVRTGREVDRLTGHTGFVTSVAFSAGGGFVAAGSLSGAIKIWDLENGNREVATFTGHSDSISTIALSPDGKWLASGSLDQTVKLWDLATGKLSRTFTGHTGEVLSVAFSPDSQTLASGSADQTLRLWDLTKPDALPKTVLDGEGKVFSIAFSPTGEAYAVGTERGTHIFGWGTAVNSVRQMPMQTETIYSVSFSADGKTLAAAGRDRAVHLYNVLGQTELKTLRAHTLPVNGVAFSPDARWLISGGEDGRVIVWDTEQGTEAATLSSGYQSDEWLAVAPDGLFDGSPVAWQQILWRFRNDTFAAVPVEVFFNDYFAPGMLADIFGNKNPKAAQALQERDRRQPVIRLAQGATATNHASSGTMAGNGASGAAADARFMRLTLDISEAAPDAAYKQGSGANDVRLFRNGALVKVWRGDVLNGQKSRTIEVSVPIVAGPNVFTAYAFNRDNVKSTDASLTINGPESLRRKAVAHILAIGINEYSNSAYNLKLAGADAQSVIAAVNKAQAQLSQFASFEVTALLNQEATKANILSALRRLGGDTGPLPANAPAALQKITPVQPEDALIIFYAGHGTADKNTWYLLPHDLGYDGPQKDLNEKSLAVMLQHAISDREIGSALENLDAGRILLILDACNSGQAISDEEKRRGPMNTRGLAQLAYEKGMYILAAAESYQFALESKKLGHGYLTYALVEEGLSGLADTTPKDGDTLAQEWLRFAARRVPEMQSARDNETGKRPMNNSLTREIGLGLSGPTKPKKLPRVQDVQRPRLFYRQELEKSRLVVARS